MKGELVLHETKYTTDGFTMTEIYKRESGLVTYITKKKSPGFIFGAMHPTTIEELSNAGISIQSYCVEKEAACEH